MGTISVATLEAILRLRDEMVPKLKALGKKTPKRRAKKGRGAPGA